MPEKIHHHYCEYRRHTWECQGARRHCYTANESDCDECRAAALRVASMVVPIVCERCGAQKRDSLGRSLYVAIAWRRGKRMVCPACFETEKTMEDLGDLVGLGNDWDDVPF